MKKTKAAGDNRERQVKKKLEAEGWVVRKARMSFGNADLLAYREGVRWLVQVKANKGSPWMNFRKEERAGLLEDAEIAGGKAFLAHWPPHGELKWYESKEWP